MANDKPTSLRMGFGYGQARAAGLGGVRQDRSPRQVNKITKANKSFRVNLPALQEAAKDPDLVPLLVHRAAEGCTPKQIAEELYWMERYSRNRSKGRSVAWCLKYHWPM